MLNCCLNCFTDQFIRSKIELAGDIGDCNFCKNKKTFITNPSELRPYFEPLIFLYGPIKTFSTKIKKLVNCDFLVQKLIDDWEIFNISSNEVQNILDSIFPDLIGSDLFVEKVALLKYNNIYPKSLDIQLEESWQNFTTELKTKNRFFPSTELNLKKLESLLQYLDIKLDKNQSFYRSRISDDDKKIFKKYMGAPPAKKARAGRGNPVGIPYLYLASDIDTAISEVRPSVLDHLTVGEFVLNRNIQVIDLRYISPFYFSLSEDFETLVFNIDYLQTLGSSLSKPINPRDTDLEYLPTQYLCEFIKRSNWNGVLYKSSLSKGSNLAVFSEEYFNCSKTTLYRVNKPSYIYEKVR